VRKERGGKKGSNPARRLPHLVKQKRPKTNGTKAGRGTEKKFLNPEVGRREEGPVSAISHPQCPSHYQKRPVKSDDAKKALRKVDRKKGVSEALRKFCPGGKKKTSIQHHPK